ncbi:TetR/AcrR family transcriptional regulator [Streptococcus sp. HF-1907]|uniref:TetR/AcrR family transcriptional regulator n=1 Tax=Streptococcus sp. HF-1907 TaxID=2785793 RepID=UPI00189E4994|nr:TetR/AcrR family transcriptional regulator [Streptococcus sp. HF-1907]MBF7094340.1 TetR/AcrR family transcriptional regulator [Streptococcus sp. HF-1907]
MANSDRRVLRTKRHIREAFVQLLEEKSLTDITVTQLADLADIDRKTFYAHYQNVTDVYLELSKEVAEQLREVLIDVDSFEVDDFLESLNDIMLANLSFFKIITSKSADKFFLTDFI